MNPQQRTPLRCRLFGHDTDRHDRVDDAVARWHAAPEGEADEPLAEYLGWTWSEYKDYVEHDLLPPERDGAV